MDSGSYIVQAFVEPPESASLLARLVIPPSWEPDWPSAIVEELALLHWLLASVSRRHQLPLAPTFAHLAANCIAPTASSLAAPVRPVFSLVPPIPLIEEY